MGADDEQAGLERGRGQAELELGKCGVEFGDGSVIDSRSRKRLWDNRVLARFVNSHGQDSATQPGRDARNNSTRDGTLTSNLGRIRHRAVGAQRRRDQGYRDQVSSPFHWGEQYSPRRPRIQGVQRVIRLSKLKVSPCVGNGFARQLIQHLQQRLRRIHAGNLDRLIRSRRINRCQRDATGRIELLQKRPTGCIFLA